MARKIAPGKPPSRIKFTFDAVPNCRNDRFEGAIGRSVDPDKDFFTITETLTTKSRNRLFNEVSHAVGFCGVHPASQEPQNVGLEWDSNTYATTGKFNTAATQFPGWSIQGADGGQPFTAEDITPVRMNASIGTGGVSLTVEVVGTRKDELRILTSDAPCL